MAVTYARKQPFVFSGLISLFALGTPIAERPPHRSVQAGFPHTAPTLGVFGVPAAVDHIVIGGQRPGAEGGGGTGTAQPAASSSSNNIRPGQRRAIIPACVAQGMRARVITTLWTSFLS
jgi:hypothetical protein